jgi:hypothetical protein
MNVGNALCYVAKFIERTALLGMEYVDVDVSLLFSYFVFVMDGYGSIRRHRVECFREHQRRGDERVLALLREHQNTEHRQRRRIGSTAAISTTDNTTTTDDQPDETELAAELEANLRARSTSTSISSATVLNDDNKSNKSQSHMNSDDDDNENDDSNDDKDSGAHRYKDAIVPQAVAAPITGMSSVSHSLSVATRVPSSPPTSIPKLEVAKSEIAVSSSSTTGNFLATAFIPGCMLCCRWLMMK